MKTIFLATDYSKSANNALNYAIELAKFSKAKLVLFHAFHIPIPITEVPSVIPFAIDELEKENEAAIKKLENKIIKQTHGKIKIESMIACGMAIEEILKAVRKKKADVIIMGMKGAGKLSEKLIGSTATFLMQKTRIPVLAIPEKSKFKRASKMVLAYDYQKTIGKDVLKHIKAFAMMFKAEVEVVNVVKLYEEPGYNKANQLAKLKGGLKGIKHNFFFPASENVSDEISAFINKQKAGMLIMLPHKHNMLEKLFYSSNTKRMAFHTNVPLLSLHD